MIGVVGDGNLAVTAPVEVAINDLSVETCDLHVASDHATGSGTLEFEHWDCPPGQENVFDVLIIGLGRVVYHRPSGGFLGALRTSYVLGSVEIHSD